MVVSVLAITASGLVAPAQAAGRPVSASTALVALSGSQYGFPISWRAWLVLATNTATNACNVVLIPGEPCRVLTTVVTATGTDATGASCAMRGNAVQSVASSVDAVVFYTVPGNPFVPGNPVYPGDPCRALGTVAVQLAVTINGGTITSASGSVDLPGEGGRGRSCARRPPGPGSDER